MMEQPQQKTLMENAALPSSVVEVDFAPPPMKHSDTRDSISSIDSDVCLAFDGGRSSGGGRGEERRCHGGGGSSSSNEDEGAHLADTSDCGSESGSATGKDSGCEVEKAEEGDGEAPFVPPDEELATRIVQQVEFYFSDVNITKDAFLLKHVKRNKEGYVSLKLISSFKRVKHLAKDWRVVAWALARSTQLQINEQGTKLRRRQPLPQYDQTTPSRTVVAMRLPSDKPTIEHVAELFACFGEIALVRILRPGNPVPADVRAFVAKRPDMAGTVSALVEYTASEAAQRAAKARHPDWPGHAQGIAVVELNAPAPAPPKKQRHAAHAHHAKKASALARLVHDAENSSSCASGSEAEFEPRPSHHAPPPRHHPRMLPKAHSYHHPKTPSSPGRVIARARTAPELCPWLQRRLSARLLEAGGAISSDTAAAAVAAAAAATRPRSNSGVAHLPENVVRMPKGPDGSQGFRARRPSTPSVAAVVAAAC